MFGSTKMLKKSLLGATSVALVGMAALTVAPKEASATAFAYAAIEVENFLIEGNTPGAFAGFSTFEFVEKGMTINLNGTIQSTGSSAAVTTGGASLDETPICLGDCSGFVDNLYSTATGGFQPTNPVPGPGSNGSFAIADMNMLNTNIVPGDGAFGAQSGAQGTGGQFSNAGTTTDQSMQWNFTLNEDSTLTFTWDHVVTLLAGISETGETASGSVGYKIQVDEVDSGDNVFLELQNTLLDQNSANIASLAPGGTTRDNSVSEIGDSTTTGLLQGGVVYSLLVTFDSSANITSRNVPEPAALGLLGVGLLGLGLVGHRRRKQRAA